MGPVEPYGHSLVELCCLYCELFVLLDWVVCVFVWIWFVGEEDELRKMLRHGTYLCDRC